MARLISAKRYAQAIFEIARERNELDEWRSDLRRIAEAMRDPQLVAFLESPKIRFSDKAELLGTQLEGLTPRAMNLTYFLVAKGRVGIADPIRTEYEHLVDAYYGIEHAEVTTAIPLGPEDKEMLTSQLAAIVDKKVVLSTEVDPDIIGGIIARIGGKLIDGSTRSKLANLRKGLIEAGK